VLVLLVERYLFVRHLPPTPDCHRYGKKKKAPVNELDAHTTANGYQRGAHWEEDSWRDGNKHEDKTRKDQERPGKIRKDQDATLDLCVM
jgi:hypothetical protein